MSTDQIDFNNEAEEMMIDDMMREEGYEPPAVEEVEPERYAGPSPVLVRQSSKQSWAQAKTLDVLKDMGPRRLADWVAGLNEVAGFAKYRVA
ncbi:hypothetical protein SEA_BABYYODA_40 [Microbacterium phage BabyYoda]|nr:hypothetical protein SEA_BABYYODA_40 [Microbacterium phage BabyYoda]